MPNHPIPSPAPRFILYQDVHSRIALHVRFDGDDVWLTQPQIALLFHTTRENVNQHIRNIYQKAELQKERTCKKFLHVQNEGRRTVQRNITHYGMDMIVAVGYRVKSSAATQFRQWATERRKQIVVEKKQREVIIVSTEKNQQK